MGCIGAILLTVLPSPRPRNAVVAAFGIAFFIFSASSSFPGKAYIGIISASKEEAEVRWSAFHRTNERANGRPVVFFIPDNWYHAQDVFIVLLKGTADFPTWNVTANGRPVLERFAPGLEFRSQRSNPVQPRRESNALYAWNEAPGLPPVRSFFPELDAALREQRASVQEIDLKTGHRFFLLE